MNFIEMPTNKAMLAMSKDREDGSAGPFATLHENRFHFGRPRHL